MTVQTFDLSVFLTCRTKYIEIMAGVVRNLLSIAVGGGFVLLGWGLMKATVPNREDMLKVGTSQIVQMPV